MRAAVMVSAVLVVAAAYRYALRGASFVSDAGQVMDETRVIVSGWSLDVVPERYRAAIAAAEDRNGIPEGMLARLLWQESRFRDDVIDGRLASPAGALGIAQFMPATAADMGIDPLDALASIDAAARYLGQLWRRFGNWPDTLAAYNWGQGNVARRGRNAAPVETRSYVASILGDLGIEFA